MSGPSFKRALIRADGRKSLGMGHINRSHLLASAISRIPGWSACLLTRYSMETEVFLSNKAPDYELIWMGSDYIFEDEKKLFLKIYNYERVNIIITDLLEIELTDSYLTFLKSFGSPITSVLDVTDFYDLDVDLIINGNPSQDLFLYKSKTIHLSGPKFFIMDERYGHYRNNIWRPESKNILLCLGGTDHNNIIFKVLGALSQFDDINIRIITSNATGYQEELKFFCYEHSINADIRVDLESLVNEWCAVDFAITAGGNVLFERIASGTPGVTVCQLTRQMEIAQLFSDFGVNINLGYGPDLKMEDLRDQFSVLLESGLWKKQQIELSKVIVPGNGLKKCVEQIIKLGA